jgi:uncharacterized protein (DUF305 family)
MAILSFVAMYALMYAMVDRAANVYASLNQVYMAALMTAPMLLIELGLMGAMYPDARRNRLIAGASALLLLGAWFGIREQSAIGNRQFLRSMIPHHAGAVLMCNQAPVTRPAIQELCRRIVQGQEEEIAEMKALLADH